ncbi:hypothetical protein [Brevundimonas sp. DC300-4]|uniref:hypothetical protein n=1 Tax=Brevundimonas sp. DC300-4 TaxID=2804594 RepID=UPI003CF43A67
MSAAPNRWLKLKTKQLIKACGGLEEASRACAESCRPYSVPHLSRCQVATAPDYLPIDIVLCLEAYCGEPIVTGAMCEARPSAVVAGNLRDELSDVVEGGAPLLGRYRAVMADRRLDARERADFSVALDDLVEEIRQAQAALIAEPEARP